MGIKPSSPEAVERAQTMLRATVRPPTSEARNVAAAADIDANSYFSYNGVYYKAPPLDYRLGIQLQEILVEIHRLGTIEEELDQDNKVPDESHIRQLLVCYDKAVLLFQQACMPVAFWKRRQHRRKNPFDGCSSGEIGYFLNFFFTCRTKSRVRPQESLVFRPSLSLSTQQTS